MHISLANIINRRQNALIWLIAKTVKLGGLMGLRWNRLGQSMCSAQYSIVYARVHVYPNRAGTRTTCITVTTRDNEEHTLRHRSPLVTTE